MADVFAYRVSDELAAALRELGEADREFAKKVWAWDEEHPGTELLWCRAGLSTDRRPVGFNDGNRSEPPPAGLSRAKTRSELVPVRHKAGDPWREVLERFGHGPRVEPVFHRFDVPSHMWVSPNAIVPVKWTDTGTDGVIVFCAGDIASPHRDGDQSKLSEHLTPIKRSEFYAINARLEAAREAAQ